jgi:hypothetical protein
MTDDLSVMDKIGLMVGVISIFIGLILIVISICGTYLYLSENTVIVYTIPKHQPMILNNMTSGVTENLAFKESLLNQEKKIVVNTTIYNLTRMIIDGKEVWNVTDGAICKK